MKASAYFDQKAKIAEQQAELISLRKRVDGLLEALELKNHVVLALRETETEMDQRTASMTREWIAVDCFDVERTARWMAYTLRIGGIRECRKLIEQARKCWLVFEITQSPAHPTEARQ